MSDFVALNSNDTLLRSDTRFLLVVCVHRSSSSDEAPVLHRSGVEVGRDESVELLKRVGDVEDFLVDGQATLLRLEGESSLRNVVVGRVNLHGNDAAGERRSETSLDRFEVSVGPRDEVGGHLGDLVELDELPVILEFSRGRNLGLGNTLSFALGLSFSLALSLSFNLADVLQRGLRAREEGVGEKFRAFEVASLAEVLDRDDFFVRKRNRADARDQRDGVGRLHIWLVEARLHSQSAKENEPSG